MCVKYENAISSILSTSVRLCAYVCLYVGVKCKGPSSVETTDGLKLCVCKVNTMSESIDKTFNPH